MKKIIILLVSILISPLMSFWATVSGEFHVENYTFPNQVIGIEKIKQGKSWTYILAMIGNGACYNALYLIPRNKKTAQLLFSSENLCSIQSFNYWRIEDFSLKPGKIVVKYVIGMSEDKLKTLYKTIFIQ